MKTTLFLISLILSASAQASRIVCEGEVDFYGEIQKFKVQIEGRGIGQSYVPSSVQRVEVSGASLKSPNVFSNAVDYWDGHSSGMITAPGFAMAYDQINGCIRDVIVTTDFRGDVRDAGMNVGHITQSHLIATCDNGEPLCLR